MNCKDEFLDLIYDNIDRDGADKLIEWLEKSDFFSAPASSRVHNAFKGGLCQHSINVYKRLLKLVESEYGLDWQKVVSLESVTIMSLFHDLCKADFYKEDVKNVKVDGVWTQVPYYKVEDSLPYGHGEKSVYILSAFMRLTREEALAINWHMGEYDYRVKGGCSSLSATYYKYPITMMLHIADMMASYLDEKPSDN